MPGLHAFFYTPSTLPLPNLVSLKLYSCFHFLSLHFLLLAPCWFSSVLNALYYFPNSVACQECQGLNFILQQQQVADLSHDKNPFSVSTCSVPATLPEHIISFSPHNSAKGKGTFSTRLTVEETKAQRG